MTQPESDRREAEEEAPRVVIRDKRRLDPVTGEVRAAPATESPGPPAPGAPTDEMAERTADLQRLSAEYANYRRRVERDRTAVVEIAQDRVLAGLLPVLDDVDRAREHGDLEGAFKAVAEQLLAVLSKAGLEGFGEAGEPFDPNRHEAVMHSTRTDVDGPTCVAVMRRGYQRGDRVLRPAMVSVAEPGVRPSEGVTESSGSTPRVGPNDQQD